MKLEKTIKSAFYRDGDFIIEIQETETERSAWLRRENSGLVSLMFGEPKEYDNTVTGEHVINNRKDFISCVSALLPLYEDDYDSEMDDIEYGLNLVIDERKER